MTNVSLVSDPKQLAASFSHFCNWADQIDICTDRFDCGKGLAPFWPSLKGAMNKIRYFIVTKRDHMPPELEPLHTRGVLRLVVDQRTRFRANIYHFRRENEVRALLGTVRLTTDSFQSDLEAMMLAEGTWQDGFACEISDFIERCLRYVRLSHAADFQDGDPYCFLAIEDRDSQARHVWEHLLGLGPMEKDVAVREAARLMKDQGMIDCKRLNSAGPVYEGILKAIDRGARIGLMDRPARGMIRASWNPPTTIPNGSGSTACSKQWRTKK